MNEAIVNKVAASGLTILDLENYLPKEEIVEFDLKNYLFMEMILKEKDFREALKQLDWSQYQNKNVTIVCSADAIIPSWAYMLVASNLQGVAKEISTGAKQEMFKTLFLENLRKLDLSEFADQRVVVKGCGDESVENYAYAEIARLLKPVVKSIMYGEPCSTVPVYKKAAGY